MTAIRQSELFPTSSGSTAGMYCCGRLIPWKEMDVCAGGESADDLVWSWMCPRCGDVLRIDPLVLPSDLPSDLSALFVGHVCAS